MSESVKQFGDRSHVVISYLFYENMIRLIIAARHTT